MEKHPNSGPKNLPFWRGTGGVVVRPLPISLFLFGEGIRLTNIGQRMTKIPFPFWALAGINLFIMVGFGLVGPVLPLYAESFKVSYTAIGFLIACHLPEAGPVTGSSGATPERSIPAAGISAETADALTANGLAKIRLSIETDETPRRTANLILDLPGTGPEWVVLSAHIDGHHLAESAMDNATGLAAVLTVAAAMAPNIGRFARGLRVTLFTVEEWALEGSGDYVDGL